MNINIEELIKEHTKWCLENKGEINARALFSNLISELSKNTDEFAVIQDAEFFNGLGSRKDFPGWEKLLRGYNIKGLFELGHIDFQNKPDSLRAVSDEYILIVLSKNKPKWVKICAVPRKRGFLGLAKSDLNEYYKDLELFINTSEIAESIKLYVNKILCKKFSYGQFDARVYTNEYLSLLIKIKKQKVVPLNELVDVVKVDLESKRESFDAESYKDNPILSKIIKDLSENLDIDWNPQIYISPSQIKKGDLIFVNEACLYDSSTRRRCYLVTEEPFQEQLMGSYSVVLRLKSDLVTPEYLYFYMQSEIFDVLSIASCRKLGGVDFSRLKQIPVLLPNTKTPMAKNKELSQKYRDLYKFFPPKIVTYGKEDYRITIEGNRSYDCSKMKEQLKEHFAQHNENVYSDIKFDSNEFKEDYYAFYKKLSREIDGEDALSEEIQERYIEEPHKQNIIKYINDTMAELKISIPNGAYQSAVVLIGAVLEAFLIDWAGEMDGENYFEKKYREVNIDGRLQPMYMKLNDAICRIGKVVKKWSARDKADAIRDMRNSIHPSVFFKQNEKLTKEKCEMALKDLNAVIKSRYADFSSDFFRKK